MALHAVRMRGLADFSTPRVALWKRQTEGVFAEGIREGNTWRVKSGKDLSTKGKANSKLIVRLAFRSLSVINPRYYGIAKPVVELVRVRALSHPVAEFSRIRLRGRQFRQEISCSTTATCAYQRPCLVHLSQQVRGVVEVRTEEVAAFGVADTTVLLDVG